MSFALTTEQMRARTKTVTRRVGWGFLKPGDRLQAVVKGRGLKKGEKVAPLAVLRVERVSSESMSDFDDPRECVKEGFPEMTPDEFRAYFLRTHGGAADLRVTRIEFSYEPESTTGSNRPA